MKRKFWAPGRVNLIGEHTDYSGGLALPVALDLGLTLTVESTAGPTRIHSPDGEIDRYVAAVAAELDALGRPPVGISGRLETTLPIGAGLSSSAALEVALGLALCAVADFALDPLELAQAARRAEQRATGVPCGIMDQAICLLGKPGHAMLLDTATLELEPVPLPASLTMVVVDSGVRRRLENSAYADRRAELERGLAGGRDEIALRRVRHVRSENERVREVVALLRSAEVDLGRLGELFREGHSSLRHDFEISIPELDAIVELAYACGAVAARMTGGGFGGSVITLVEHDQVGRFISSLGGSLPGTRAFEAGAGAGAHEIT
jgi:galactokinase